MPSALSRTAVCVCGQLRQLPSDSLSRKSETAKIHNHNLSALTLTILLRASICRVTFQIAAEIQNQQSLYQLPPYTGQRLKQSSALTAVFQLPSSQSSSWQLQPLISRKKKKRKTPLHRMRSILGTCSAAETRDEMCGVTQKSDYSFLFPPQRRDYKTPNTYLIRLSPAQSPFTNGGVRVSDASLPRVFHAQDTL